MADVRGSRAAICGGAARHSALMLMLMHVHVQVRLAARARARRHGARASTATRARKLRGGRGGRGGTLLRQRPEGVGPHRRPRVEVAIPLVEHRRAATLLVAEGQRTQPERSWWGVFVSWARR
jgi:hypothetical protein